MHVPLFLIKSSFPIRPIHSLGWLQYPNFFLIWQKCLMLNPSTTSLMWIRPLLLATVTMVLLPPFTRDPMVFVIPRINFHHSWDYKTTSLNWISLVMKVDTRDYKNHWIPRRVVIISHYLIFANQKSQFARFENIPQQHACIISVLHCYD